MIETRLLDNKVVVHLKDMNKNATGYYVTLDGETVYSTKRAKLFKMEGYVNPANKRRYYKFSNNGWSWNFTAQEIKSFLARVKSELPAEQVLAGVVAPASGTRGAYVVGRQRAGKPLELFHSHAPTLFSQEKDARALAEKVAQGEPGVKIVVLQVVGEVIAGGLNWS